MQNPFNLQQHSCVLPNSFFLLALLRMFKLVSNVESHMSARNVVALASVNWEYRSKI